MGVTFDRVPPHTTLRDIGAVALLWLAATGLYYSAGVRFDATPFPGFMQFIDADLLASRLVESLWYSHAHPPLLNLFVGLGARLFGDGAVTFYTVSFYAMGLILALAVFALALRLSASRVGGYLCVALVVLNPSFALYQSWLMYSFPEAALLTITAVAMYKYFERESAVWAATAFVSIMVLALTRSLFHLAWFVAIVGYVLVLACNKRRVLAAAALPVLLVALWYGKNFYYYGAFSGSTMLGLGLSNIATLTVTRAELEPLVADGTVSPLALLSRYEQTAELFAFAAVEPTGVPVLDQVRKATGEFNFNYRGLIEVDRIFTSDALHVVRRYPANYVVGLLISNRLFFSPTSMNEYFSTSNREAARPIERLFNTAVLGARAMPSYLAQPHFGFDRPPSLEVNTSTRLVALWAAALAFCYVRGRRAFLGAFSGDKPACAVLGFMGIAMIYVHVVGTALELGENYRYRFAVEPFFFVVLTVAAADIARWARRRLTQGSVARAAP